jgi:alkanesulfonate monooxygenase
VNAWNSAELEQAGIPFPEHDARYAFGAEWLSVVESLLRGERVTHSGPHFRVKDYALRPEDPCHGRPRLHIGGESEPAEALAAAQGDVWFINGLGCGTVR